MLDHQVRIIQAVDAESAYLAALSLGEQSELTYPNEAGEAVTCEFLGLGELMELPSGQPRDGGEVYSWGTTEKPSAVRTKAELDVFRSQIDGHRTARDLLDE
jgi:hypothetical protein